MLDKFDILIAIHVEKFVQVAVWNVRMKLQNARRVRITYSLMNQIINACKNQNSLNRPVSIKIRTMMRI